MASTDAPSLSPDLELASTDGHGATAQTAEQKAEPRTVSRKEPWLSSKAQKLAAWLATSEPSARALRQYRKESFKKAGISPKDTEPPNAKLHAPIGEIPADAIRPSTGPTPEALARKKAADRRKNGHSKRPDGALKEQVSFSGSWSAYSGQGATPDLLNTFPYIGPSG
ncbi:uncharacterized protein B0H64DRAFT_88039 [Chaetomium fimeti]|uniref:Uncharacterized protein n=1 Tax=Chaetomium fimeti TaxID=1854472 RepID=A0AAE0HMN6_9PEZI|nr:hypothetical protein B0H64DRAFT_88039 [Chaetomium fimeti]